MNMKKTNILYLLSAVLLTVSCSTDFLDTKSQTEIMADDIWKEKSLAEAYMYDIYFAFQDAGFTEELQASACDEAMFTHGREFRMVFKDSERTSMAAFILEYSFL